MLLSIAIPTKNRFEYASQSILALCENLDTDTEIVVQDNSDSAKLLFWLKENGFEHRVRYENNTIPLGNTENFNLAINRCIGEFVAVIGDDDAVNPEIVKLPKILNRLNLDAAVGSNAWHYYWPDFSQKYVGDKMAGQLIRGRCTGDSQIIDTKKSLPIFLKNGGFDLPNTCLMPKLYYGIIRRSVLEQLKIKGGNFILGISPDMASSVGVATLIDRHLFIDYPIFVPGSSAKSTAGQSARKEHIGKLEDQPNFSRSYIDKWPNEVPKFFSVETIWLSAMVTTLQSIQRNDLISEIDFDSCNGFCAARNPSLVPEILKFYRSQGIKMDWRSLERGKNLLSGFARFNSQRTVGFLNKFYKTITGDKYNSSIQAPNIRVAIELFKNKQIGIDVDKICKNYYQ